MNDTLRRQFNPFFDQENPERPILGLIASADHSPSYELAAVGVFAVNPVGYLIVDVSGCSCWPDRGSTSQVFCEDKASVDRALQGDKSYCGPWNDLLEAVQNAKWEVTQPVKAEDVTA